MHNWLAALLGALLAAAGVAVALALPYWLAAVDAPPSPELRPEMLVLPVGEFWMGSPEDEEGRQPSETMRRVRIPRAFALGRTEVTQAQWQAVMGGNPSWFKGDERPVERVTWFAAVDYLNRLSRREGLPECYATQGPKGDPNDGGTEKGELGTGFTFEEVTFRAGCTGYRLPTTAEWEYAVRAGTAAARYGDLIAIAWWSENSGRGTRPVAGRQANPWFFFDLVGNVWEWVHSGTSAVLKRDPTTQEDFPSIAWNSLFRHIRGCGWDATEAFCRAAGGSGHNPGYHTYSLGFRPARFLPLDPLPLVPPALSEP